MIRSDDQFFPVILTSWRAPFTADRIDAYFDRQREHAERAKREGTWLVSITQEGDTPNSAERKHIADRTRQMPKELLERTVASYAIVTNPMKRGALTALGWLISDLAKVEAVSSEEEALARAERALVERGVSMPEDLDTASLRRALAALEAVPEASGS